LATTSSRKAETCAAPRRPLRERIGTFALAVAAALLPLLTCAATADAFEAPRTGEGPKELIGIAGAPGVRVVPVRRGEGPALRDIPERQWFLVPDPGTWTGRLDLLRSDFPSDYGYNAYYTATGGTLSYDLNRSKFFGGLFVRLQNNDYELPDPVTGEARSDDIKTFRLGLGYRFTDIFSLNGSYLYEERESLFAYSYEVNIFTLSLIIGY